MGGPTVAGFEGSFVLQLIDACPCNFWAKMVQKHLEEIHGIGSISTDAAEGKITISGSMVDPYTVMTELEKLMIKATLFSEEIPIEKQIVLHKSEVLEGQSKVEPHKPADNNQVVDEFASSLSPDIQSKHEHELELINFHEKVTISALYLVLVFVMAGFGGQFLIRNLVDFLRRASIILFFLSGFIFASALIMGSMVALYTVITELEKLKKKVTLLGGEIPIKNTIEEKQIVLRKSEVLEGQVGLCKPADNNQVVGEFALSLSPDIQSKHEHMLELQNFDKRFTCSGCKEEGFRKRYRCKHCDYELHEECRHPKHTISHELFEGLDFKFCHEKPTCGILCRDHTKSCEACGNGIHGYSYHCEAKDLFLHPMCVNLLGKICILGKTFALKKKGTIKCSWCNSTKKTKSGWSYVSKSTKWQLHVNCVTEIAHQAWKEQDVGGGNDPYIMIEKRLNSGLVENKKRSEWFKGGGKSVKMILVFARTIIGILLGDPTVILASTFVEIFKKS